MTTRLRQTFAQLGRLNAVLYLLGRAMVKASGGRWTLHRYHFVAQYIGDAPLSPERGRDIDIRFTSPHDAVPDDYPRPAVVVRERYTQGAQSLTAWRNGRLAGFLWLIQDAYQEDEVRVRYRLASSRASWDFDVWVRPEERLGWVFRRLWEAARRHLRQQGVRWSCSRISAFNPASLRAHAQIGTVRLGGAVFVCCGEWQWMMASLAPYIHLSRGPASYPQLMFDTSALADIAHQEPPCPTPIKSARY
jgi:GNAT superfamily N-acetyltransferase